MGTEQESGVLREGQRPSVEYEGRERYGIWIEPSLYQYLLDLGGDDASEGVRVAVRFHKEHANPQK